MNKPQPVAPVPTMSQEEVERLRELLAANDLQSKARSKEALEQQKNELEEKVTLAARFQDQLNSVEFAESRPVLDSWEKIRDLAYALSRVRLPVLVKEQLSRTGFDVKKAVEADRLIITMLQARLDSCADFESDWEERLALLNEHLGPVRTHSESKVRDIDYKIADVKTAIKRAGAQREENTQKLVGLGLDLGLAREKAKPSDSDVKNLERELDYLVEQREKHAAIVRSNEQQAQIAFAPPRED